MSIGQEFKDFALKGNVVDMGVGIVIGAAFTTIVESLVSDIINPIIGFVSGGVDFSNLFYNLGSGDFANLASAKSAGAPTINYGLFINAIIAFLIVAFVLFMIIRSVNRMKKNAEPEETPRQEVLLEEIRDAMRARLILDKRALASLTDHDAPS